MQGSLFIPLRGSAQQIAHARGDLFINARHPEGHNLGLARFPLDRWARGELSEEERASSNGLSNLKTSAPLMWIDATKEGGLWWVDEAGGVGYESPDSELGDKVKSKTSLGTKRAPVSLEGAHFCAQGDRLFALVANADAGEGSWGLWEVKFSEEKARGKRVWSGDFDVDQEVYPTAAKHGPGVCAWGLSDGRVALWFDACREKQWSPLFTQPHSASVCALSYVRAEDKDYLLTYSEDLTLAQTRLDDLEPMPRAANGKGLHTTPPVALIAGPVGRFYSLGADGARAWSNAYSNLRPAAHEEVGEHLEGRVVASTIVTLPVRDLEGDWQSPAALAVAGPDQLIIYQLLNPSEAEEAARGEDLSSQRGRLGDISWRAEGAESWIRHRISSEEEATRRETIKTLVKWGDDSSLKALERIASRDSSSKLRQKALSAIISSEHPSVIHALSRLLGAEYPQVACAALDALRASFGHDSLYPMSQAIKVGGAGVSEHAIKLLGSLGVSGHDGARTALKEQLDHQDPDLAEVARAQIEGCYAVPRGALIGLASRHDGVRTMAIHRLWEEGVTARPLVSGRLQQLREEESREVRRYALAVTLLGHPVLSDILRASDPLLHEELNKVQARTLSGEARAAQLSAEAPNVPSEVSFDARARQLLFEVSAGGRADVAVHGPVALAQTGDLRALPSLLSLSRSDDGEVRLRATHGLANLAQGGERRARAQLQSLSHDDLVEVRQAAYRGLAPLFDEPLDYAEFGLNATHTDIRLAALTSLQDAPRYQAGSRDARAHEVLSLALCLHDDLGLAQEARKVYLRDQVGGSAEQALSLILRSVHLELRQLALRDLLESLKGKLVTGAPSGHVAPGAGLEGQSFLFTGTLEKMKRSDAQNRVKELGGSIASGVSANLSYLVIGDKGKAGSKLTKANQLGVAVLSETAFWEMLEVAANPTGSDAAAEAPVEEADLKSDQSVEEAEREREATLAEVMSKLFNDPSGELRLESLEKLIGEHEGEGALRGAERLAALDLALASSSRDVRLAAVQSLSGGVDSAEARSRLRALVADREIEVARAALRAALKLAEGDLNDLVEEGLALEDESLRTLAVEAAARAPKKLSWREGVLLRAIADGVSGVREVAFAALRADEVVTVAAQLLDHERSDIRDRAALTLARVGDERALQVALEALQAPAPVPDEVIAAQEAMGGSFGLLDDLQWKRQVTLALSAQQRAFAAAGSAASVSSTSEDQSESSDDSGRAESVASASAVGVAYAEQSLSALVSVNDEIEGAVERATRRWRERISAGLRIVREGRFESAFEVVWSLANGDDVEVAAEALQTIPSCIAEAHLDLIEAHLNSDPSGRPLAWSLVLLGDPRGLSVMISAHATQQAQVEAAISLGGSSAERALALSVARGGEAAEAALHAEVLRLIHFGGDCPLIAAGLSSEGDEWRRTCAQWVSVAHDSQGLKGAWDELIQGLRPRSDIDWERSMERFEAGELKEKPKGAKPHWVSDIHWRQLAELLEHPERRARRFAASALFNLPTSSDSARLWVSELERQTELARVCYERRDAQTRASRPILTLPKKPQLSLSEAESQALAFGTYASLVSGSKDVKSLASLSPLFSTDPVGARAVLQMSLRDDGALQREALELLEREAETLGLNDNDRADLLISTDQTTCVRRGAQLLARVDSARALGLVLSDDGEAAHSAARALLELEPARGVELFSVSLKSPNVELRGEMVDRWAGLLRAWPDSKKPLSEDDDQALSATRLEALDLKVLRVLSKQMSREESLEALLAHLNGDDAARASSDVQLRIAERLRAERALTKGELSVVIEPLKRLLASTEPHIYRRALHALRDSEAEGAASAILDRILHDPTRSADPDETLRALSQLRDAQVVKSLIEQMGDALGDPEQSRFEIGDLERCLLEISGHDERIEEDAIWDEMDEEERKAEEQRAYQDATLASLIDRCAQLGRYDEIYYTLDLIDAAQTARSADVNDSLTRLTQLPMGGYEINRTRQGALDALVWRTRHRDYDPSPLIHLVDHRELATRVTAAEALAYGGRAEGIKLLIGVARDRHESYSLRDRCVKALGASGDLRAVQTLLQLFDDAEDYLRVEALEALGAMRHSEIADEILSRLINALSDSQFVEAAIDGLISFDREEGWSAMRRILAQAKSDSSVQELLAEALAQDPSTEVVPLFERVIAEGDLYCSDTRVQAYRSWCVRSRREAGVGVDQTEEILEPALHLFKSDLTSPSAWSEAVEVIVEHAAPPQCVELAFNAYKMSKKHQGEVSKLEAKLRALDPAPLDLLLPRLSDAISDAPQLARMTLAILGARAHDLTEADQAQLLASTSDVRSTWLTHNEARKAGAVNDEFKVVTELWRQLLWLWGRAVGGASALWEALETPDLHVELYREALFSLEARLEAEDSTLKIDERLIASPAATIPELSPVLTRVATQAGISALALSEDRAESLGGLSLGDWDALREGDPTESAETLLEATRRGDAMALSALIGQQSQASVVTLLGEVTRGDLDGLTAAARLELIRSCATLGSSEVEDALVTLAKTTSDEDLAREAWRARRRSSRRRQQSERRA